RLEVPSRNRRGKAALEEPDDFLPPRRHRGFGPGGIRLEIDAVVYGAAEVEHRSDCATLGRRQEDERKIEAGAARHLIATSASARRAAPRRAIPARDARETRRTRP